VSEYNNNNSNNSLEKTAGDSPRMAEEAQLEI